MPIDAETITVKGQSFSVTVQRARADNSPQRAYVYVGSDAPGWRRKDGPDARRRRREVKLAVARALGLPPNRVGVQAVYSCLTTTDDGAVERRNAGHVIGVYIREEQIL